MTVVAPPPPVDPRDVAHLDLLKVLHYVWAGISLIGGCTTGAMSAFFAVAMPEMMRTLPANGGAGAPPAEFFERFAVLYGVMGGLYFAGFLTLAILSFVTARRIHARRSRTFCIVASAANCMAVPLGTALGVTTIMILNRESVARMFDAGDSPGPAA